MTGSQVDRLVVPDLAAALALPGAGHLLEVALAARFGRQDGGVASAASAELGVSAATVRRWLAPRAGRATVPARSRAGVLEAVRPSVVVRRREELERLQAEDGLRRWRAGVVRGDQEQWRESTRWTEPHTLSLLELPELELRRLAVTAANDEVLLRRARAGAHLVEDVTVSSRFAAVLVRAALLEQVDGWRVQGEQEVLGKGRTQVWLNVAAHPLLRHLAGQRFTTR